MKIKAIFLTFFYELRLVQKYLLPGFIAQSVLVAGDTARGVSWSNTLYNTARQADLWEWD